MELCGLSDAKTARKKVEEDLDSLANLEIEHRGYNGFAKIRIIGTRILKNGIITVALDPAFAKIYASDKFFEMYVSPEIFALNDKRNPNSYHLGRFIHVHKSRNIGADNADIISVRTLLKACPNLATHDEIKEKGNRRYKERIIEPFERDLNALNKIFTWSYKQAGSDGRILTAEEAKNLSYEDFIALNIVINWLDYPYKPVIVKEAKSKKSKNTAKKA